MSAWLVREARREDWPKIRRFFKELDSTSRYMYFGGHVSDDIIDRVWERFESRDSDKFFVVDLGDQIIGMCQVACVKNHGEISVAVHPDHRQQSIAHSLVERAVVWCKTHDILDLMMFCLPNHNIIHASYKNTIYCHSCWLIQPKQNLQCRRVACPIINKKCTTSH
jgi:N-acetylglutamate synthase-like GNAT family acetyltransferase